MNCLIISNMGPSKYKPAQGRFVTNQFDEINKDPQVNASLFLMPEKAYEYNNSLLRYGYFLLSFINFCLKTKDKFDIIHIHFFYPTVLFAYLYKLFFNRKVVFVATFHGTDVYAYSLKSSLYKFFIGKLKSRIYVSKKLAERHSELSGQATVISAGILNTFNYIHDTVKKFDFVFVGNLELVKGADRLLKFVKDNKDKSILVVGNGSFSEQFSSLKHSGLTYLKSATPAQLCTFFNQSKCLINLSRNESFGLVIAEALSCGVPVVAADTDGASEQLYCKKLGIIVGQNFSNEEIESSFNKLQLSESSDLIEIRAKSAEKYQLRHVAKRVISEYKNALK